MVELSTMNITKKIKIITGAPSPTMRYGPLCSHAAAVIRDVIHVLHSDVICVFAPFTRTPQGRMSALRQYRSGRWSAPQQVSAFHTSGTLKFPRQRTVGRRMT